MRISSDTHPNLKNALDVVWRDCGDDEPPPVAYDVGGYDRIQLDWVETALRELDSDTLAEFCVGSSELQEEIARGSLALGYADEILKGSTQRP